MDITDLKSFVDNKLADNSVANRWILLDAFKAQLLRVLVCDLLNNPDDLKKVASRSYHHKNGFLKVLLLDQRPRYSIRLHIWPTNEFQDTHIHDHPWDMSAMILNGEYSWKTYKLLNMNKPKVSSIYECKYLSDYSGHYFSFKRKIGMQEKKTIRLKAGYRAELSSKEYHKVVKNNDYPADSVIITGSSKSLKAKIITSENLPCGEVFYNCPVKYEYLKDELHKFIKRY